MAKPIELGLVLEGEDTERFFEYDENPEVSDELIAMFIEGRKYMSKTDENFRASIPSSELVIVPLNEHHNLLSYNCSNNCSNSELNDFLKNDSLDDQNNLITRTGLCFWNAN